MQSFKPKDSWVGVIISSKYQRGRGGDTHLDSILVCVLLCIAMLDRSRHSTTPYPHNINIKHQPISFQFQPSNLYIHRVHKRA